MTAGTESTPAQGQRREPRRLTALDGLRGLASLMVVLTHVRLATEVPGPPATRSEILANFAANWPLWIAGDGAAAVTIFFVLSGIVLVLPFLKRRDRAAWLAYYPRRLVRIYLPVWGSIVLALAWYFLVPRRADPTLAPWMADHVANLGTGALVRAFLLIQSTDLNTPLWSLHWEIQFSLLLPLFVGAVLTRGRWTPWLLVAASLASIFVGANTGNGQLLYLPQFLIGAVVATHLTQIIATVSSWGRPLKVALALATLAGIGGASLLETVAPGWGGVAWLLRISAATATVVIFLGCGLARRLADHRVVQWLGRISFSLYLVHEPLVVSLRLLIDLPYWPMLALAVALSLGLAQLFYVAVERPAHHLSQWVGRWVLTRV